jgi:serine/threonine protein kinase
MAMSVPFSAHPTDQALRSFVQSKLDLTAAEAVSGHLVDCSICRARVADLSPDSTSGGRPGSGDRPDSAPPVGSSLELESKNVETEGSDHSLRPDMLPPGLGDHPDYRVIRELGRGGMGVVYLAHNQLMDRDEVLKVMGRHIIEKPGVLERFLREIRAVARLRHPNIVTAYSAFRLPDSIVFAMEYVDGYDLSKLVKTKGPLSVAHASYFIHQAALGLQHAHEEGMVHRDIKPGNLMLSRKGDRATIKVLDFGLAKATREQPLDRGLTQEGQMLGTPDYIAPEQTLDAQKADIRADIYSLGCTLYYLLKGGPPFQGSSLFEVLQSHQSREPRPLDLVRADVPAELTTVVARMMAKQPENRFQTPAEVAKALVPFFKGGKPAPSVTRKDPSPAVSPAAITHPPKAPPSPMRPTTHTPPPTPRATKSSTSSPTDSQIVASSAQPARDQESTVSPGRAPTWMWPSVAAGVLLLGALFTWASGAFTPKAPEARIEPKGQTALAPIVVGQGQSKVEIPVSAIPAKLKSPAPEQKTESRGAETRSSGELASVGTGTKGPTKIDGRPRPSNLPEGSLNTPGARPEIPSPKKVDEEASTALPGPSARPALLPSNGPLHQDAGSWRMTAPPVKFVLVAESKERAPGEFWPELSAENSQAWLAGDPGAIKLTNKGLSLEKGSAGNLLLTRRSDYTKCSMSITLAADENAEAYLALRAHLGPDGWHAVTSRIVCEGGKVRAGFASIDFQTQERGHQIAEKPAGKTFMIRFVIDDKGADRVFINGQETSSLSNANHPVQEYVGAVGLFVKSGKVLIESLNVSEK